MIARTVVIACYRDAIDLIVAGFHPESDFAMKGNRAFVDRRGAGPDDGAVLLAAEFEKAFVDGFAFLIVISFCILFALWCVCVSGDQDKNVFSRAIERSCRR